MVIYTRKTVYVGLIFLLAISSAESSEYQCMNRNGTTCIDMKMDVLFTLSNGEEVVNFDGSNFTAMSGDCAKEGEYKAVLTLENFYNEDLFSFSFESLSDLSVNMSLMFTFSPFEFFPGKTEFTSITLMDTANLQLGKYNQLYRCESFQKMTLISEFNGTTYTMYMDMSNVQIQAFNIKNGNLSTDVFVCTPDLMTTTEPTQTTTESGTTVMRTTISETYTSEVPTESPLPTWSTYNVIGDDFKPCLIMAGRFQLQVKYMGKENVTTKRLMNVPEIDDVIVTGTCAPTQSSMTISPKNDAIKDLTFLFQVDTNTSKAFLMSWSTEINLDLFPDAKEANLKHTVLSPVPLSHSSLYYKCDKGGIFSDDILTFLYRNFRVQAFNIEDGTFSNNGEDCKADVEPIPAQNSPPVNTFSVSNGNETCVVFKGSIQFYIPYMSKTGVSTEVISLPANYSIDGDCNVNVFGVSSQQLTISFYETWILTMYFSSDEKENRDLLRSEEGVNKYYISRIYLKYVYNSILFQDADDIILDKEMKVSTGILRKLTTDKNKSYKCKEATTFYFDNGLSMVTKDLQYQAFKTGDSADFGAAVNCEKEEENRHFILYVSLGAAVGGSLVVVVIIVHVINKRRKYETLTL